MTAQRLADPFTPGFNGDPHPLYALLRETAPVYQHPLGFWVLSRYEDVSCLLRANLSVDPRNATSGSFADLRQAAAPSEKPGRAKRLAMVHRDPPDHTRLRRLVSKAFTPKAVQTLKSTITDLVDRMLDDIDAAGSADLVAALAFPLPFTVLAEMLGTPPADHERIRDLTGTLARELEPVTDAAVKEAIAEASAELTPIMVGMIAWKREHPADDLLTALIEAEDDGDTLSDAELIAQVLMLHLAGHETTGHLISAGTNTLLRAPDQLEKLRRDPGLVTNAVEELLRYETPVQLSRRITLEPVNVRDVTIPMGAFMLLSLASANRDERFFGDDAAELRLDRENARQHVSFGAGPHHCLGASLGRLEASIAIGRLVARFPDLAPDGDVTWNGRMNLRGITRFPIRVR
jgi:cytochrome P450